MSSLNRSPCALGVLVDEQKVEPVLQNSHIDITLRVKKKNTTLSFCSNLDGL